MSVPEARPDVRSFLDALAANPRPAFTYDNIAELRPLAAGGFELIDPPVGELARTEDLVMPGPGGDLPLRWFDARHERERGPVVIFFHGGGFVIGGVDTHNALCAEIARQLDVPVVSVGYRLAPEDPWPAAPDDAEAAARWIGSHGDAFGRDFSSIVFCGDSAGGTLSLITSIALRDQPAAIPVIGQLAFYPAADPGGTYPSGEQFADGFGLDRVDTDWYHQAYDPDPAHWRAAPIHADLAGLAPTVLMTAELDPLRDQGRAFAARLAEAGVTSTYLEAKGNIHGFATFRQIIPSAHHDVLAALDAARSLFALSAS